MTGMTRTFRLIELLSMAERTAMPVADDPEVPLAAPGYRMTSAGLAAGPGDGASLLVPR